MVVYFLPKHSQLLFFLKVECIPNSCKRLKTLKTTKEEMHYLSLSTNHVKILQSKTIKKQIIPNTNYVK